MANLGLSDFKFIYPQSDKITELYRDVVIPEFSVGDRVLWNATKEFRQGEGASCNNFGVGIIHRIVHYVHPKSRVEHILAFVYFMEWVPDSVEVTWPDGDRYYRLLLPVSDLSALDNKSAKRYSKSSEILLRPCHLNNATKSSHPIIVENATIFNIHKKRGVKGEITGFFIQKGNFYIEVDFELEIYPDELVHSSLCDHDSNGCDYRLAINLSNLSKNLWDSEFKLVIDNARLEFEDVFVKSEPIQPLNSEKFDSETNATKPSIRFMPTIHQPSYPTLIKPPQLAHTPPNLATNSTPNLTSTPIPHKNIEPNDPVPSNRSSDRNHKSVTSLMRELGSKLTLRKKKPSSKKESSNLNQFTFTPPQTLSQNIDSTPNITPPANTHYVGEYYNDFSVSENNNDPPPKFNSLSKTMESKPKASKPSFRSNKSYPAPPPPLPSSQIPVTKPIPSNIPAQSQPSIKNTIIQTPSQITVSAPPPPPLPSPIVVPQPPPPPITNASKTSGTLRHPSSEPRSNLLQQIRCGVSLRHVDPDAKPRFGRTSPLSVAHKNKVSNGEGGDFASIMMGALASRRAMIENDSDSSDSDDNHNNGISYQKDTDLDNGWD